MCFVNGFFPCETFPLVHTSWILGPHCFPIWPPISAHQTTLGRREAIGQQTQIGHLRAWPAWPWPQRGILKSWKIYGYGYGISRGFQQKYTANAANMMGRSVFRVSHGILFLHICGAFMQSVYQFHLASPVHCNGFCDKSENHSLQKEIWGSCFFKSDNTAVESC